MDIAVDPKDVVCAKFLGFGAEWDPKFWADYNVKLGVTEADWNLVTQRIRWMHLPLVRMMMLTQWCTPQGDGHFDWQNRDMQSVYRHLDVCQKLGITVILTDWGCASWAKVPGFTGNADPKYADAIGTYMDYLLNTKGYSCIRYFVLVNEPNLEAGGWDNWKKGVENVAKQFAQRGLDKKLTFMGSDHSGADEWHRQAVDQLAHVLGAYDIHRYAPDSLVRPGQLEGYFRAQWDYALAHDPQAKGKPFVVGEAGMADGMVAAHANTNIAKYEYGVFMADYAVQAARAGTSAVSAWMLDDSSHDGFSWGLWPGKAGGFKPRPWFYTWSLLTRYVPKGATILRPTQPSPDLRVLAARIAQAHWTFCLVNRGDKPLTAMLRLPDGPTLKLKRFVYSPESAAADKDGFPTPVDVISADLAKGIEVTCPANGVVILTSFEPSLSATPLEQYLADCDKRYSEEHRMLGNTAGTPGYHTRIKDGTWAHSTRESLDYALALLRSGEPRHVERAAAVIRKVLSLQDTDPASRTYGIWPWFLEEPLEKMSPPDWNWADFCGARLAQMLAGQADRMPPDLSAQARTSLGHAAQSIVRRNVGPGYTNIAIMGAGVTLAAGELLDDPKLLDYGRQRLHRIVEHTDLHGGFNEYNSPTYTIVALHECERILRLVRDPAARVDAEKLRCVAWQSIAEHYHPGTRQWAGPHSRAYSNWLDAGTAAFLSEQTGVEVRSRSGASPRPRFSDLVHLPCPPELVARFKALPEDVVELRSRFIRRDTDEASTWGTTWLVADACLGSVNHDSLWTQRHPLIAYWRTDDDPAVVLRLRFLHDGRDFASAYVRNVQRGPRVLSVIGLVTNLGDFHPSLDRPPKPVFEAEDFRVRYELTGRGVAAGQLGPELFTLSAGSRRAVIRVAPSRFGPHEVAWQLGRGNDQVYVDGVCYHGERQSFDLSSLGEVAVAAGFELLQRDQPPGDSALSVRKFDADQIEVTWPIAEELRVTAPARPEPCR